MVAYVNGKRLVKLATAVAHLILVSVESHNKIGCLRKLSRVREIENNFLTAWNISMKLGALVHHVHGWKFFPREISHGLS